MKLMKKNILDSKKFNIVFTVINIILIVALVIYLIFMHFNMIGGKSNAQEIGNVDVESLVSEADASMPGVYSALLQGSDFTLSDGVEYHFGLNGEYSGFFDSDTSAAEGYSYEVQSEDGKTFSLLIYNEDKSKYVEYNLNFNTDGNITLTYPGTDQTVVLEY